MKTIVGTMAGQVILQGFVVILGLNLWLLYSTFGWWLPG